MKTRIAAAVLFAAFVSAFPRPAQASVSVSITFFHEELAPYGRWVDTPAYGEVWYPTGVRAGWAPYVDGEWVYTDCGWTWVSYDPFSDPFHYGTWVWIEPYGWCWEPGYVWGPAWVTWAWTDTYIGWAPLPATFAITGGGYFGGAVTVPASRYVFAPVTRFAGTNISTVRVATAQNPTILTHAQRTTRYTVSSGLVRAGGPPASLVERGTGRPLHATKVTSLKNVRPAMVSTAHGGRLSIVAPARDRAAAPHSMAAGREPKTTKAISQKAATSRPVHKEKETARVSRTEGHAPAPALERHETRPVRHQEKAPAGPPPASVGKKHEGGPPPQAKAREEHRAALNRPAEPPHAARAEAPPPRVAQPQPHTAPPPAAARPPEQPREQGQGKGPKKEKPQR